jgi:hypothetical protein
MSSLNQLSVVNPIQMVNPYASTWANDTFKQSMAQELFQKSLDEYSDQDFMNMKLLFENDSDLFFKVYTDPNKADKTSFRVSDLSKSDKHFDIGSLISTIQNQQSELKKQKPQSLALMV